MKKKKARKNRKTFITNPAPAPRRRRRRRAAAASAAPKRRRKYRRNPSLFGGDSMALIMGGVGLVGGAVGVPKLVSILPVSNTLKNIGTAAAGAAVALFHPMITKKRVPLVTGIGAGMFAAGAAAELKNRVPLLAGAGEYTQNEMDDISFHLAGAAALEGEADENYNALNGPAVLDGVSTMGGGSALVG